MPKRKSWFSGQEVAMRRLFLGLLLYLWTTTSDLRAQMDTGAVLGTVKDQSGAVVPNAVVTLANEGTALLVSTSSGVDGSYIFTPVRIGTYTVTSEAKGFKKEAQLHVKVDVQERAVVDFILLPGAV